MIQTASILWAVLATGGAVFVYFEMRADYRWALNGWKRACNLHREQVVGIHERHKEAIARAIDAEDRLRKIEQTRHQSAKHARQAQLAQQRAKVLEQASKLVPAKLDRIAA